MNTLRLSRQAAPVAALQKVARRHAQSRPEAPNEWGPNRNLSQKWRTQQSIPILNAMQPVSMATLVAVIRNKF